MATDLANEGYWASIESKRDEIEALRAQTQVEKLEKALQSILESANKALDYPGGISLEGYAAVSLWNIRSRAGVALSHFSSERTRTK